MFQVVIMMGRLVEDPELRHTPSGVAVTTFRLAVDRPYKAEGRPTADFFNVVVWRQQAEFVCEYFRKGKPIVVRGRFENRDYTANDGQKRYITELIAERVGFAGDSSGKDKPPIGDPPPEHKSQAQGGTQSAGSNSDNSPGAQGFEEMPPPSDEDLPF